MANKDEERSGEKSNSKSDSQKSNRRGQRGKEKEKEKPLTKVIIRNLPPTMSEEEFLKQIDPLPEHENYYYCLADWSLGYEATCRAYITFKNIDDIFLFRDRFDGYVFVDSRGAEYISIVEYAPFQGFAKKKSRGTDNKANTIEGEHHFQQFLDKLAAEREESARLSEVKIEFTLDRKKEEQITSTPLLQYLANKKEKRREEAKKRNEEKKKQREEERQRQTQTQQPKKVLKNAQGNNSNEQSGKQGNSKSGQMEKQGQGDRKNSRSKRRSERDQRRREEYEQRKKLRERQDNDQHKKSNVAVNTKNLGVSDDLQGGAAQNKESRQSDERDIVILRKETKSKTTENETTKDSYKNKGNKSKNCPKNREVEVNENVKSFIRNVANVNSKEEQEFSSSTHLKTDSNTELRHKFETQISLEERRIRNKDRPSIAIYQPKARLETETKSGSKGSQNNAVSDNEDRNKRVKRYSDRRTERRAKAKGSVATTNDPNPQQSILNSNEDDACKRKNSESSPMVN